MGRAGPTTTRRIARAFAAGAWVLVSAAAAAAGTDPVGAEVAVIERDVQALRTLRDGLLREVRARQGEASAPGRDAPGAPGPLVITLRFPELIFYPLRGGGRGKADLVVTLRSPQATRWLLGRGETPGWHPGPHFADASALDLRDGHLRGSLRAHLGFARGKYHRHAAGIDLELDIDARIEDRQVTGTWRTPGTKPIPETPWVDYTSDGVPSRSDTGPVPPREGTLIGAVRQARLDPPELPAPRFDLKTGPGGLAVKRARWHEAEACSLYRQIHACALALECGLAVEHAWELTPAYVPERPEANPGAPGPPAGSKGVPSLDDALEGTGLPGGLIDGPKRPAGETPAQEERRLLAAVRPSRAYVAALRQAAEGYRPGGGRPRRLVTGSTPCADPDFGPWFGEHALASGEDGANVLPQEAGGPGLQRWDRIEGWRLVGPLPALFRADDVPTLPELVPAAEGAAVQEKTSEDQAAPAAANVAGSRRAGTDAADEVLVEPPEEASAGVYAGLGHVRAPAWATVDERAVRCPPGLSFYAATEVVSPRPNDLWLGITVNDGGALWINDRLVWRSPIVKDPRREEDVYLLKASFAEGTNRLVLRVDNHVGGAYFSVRISTRGGPRSTEEVRRQDAALAAAYEKIESRRAGTPARRGWRGDWSGKYPNARPPVAWDIERGTNVRWRVPLGSCHATPVIVGDRILTSLEPHTLLALDKNTGAVLWKRDCDILEFRDEALRQGAAEARAKADEAERELLALGATKEDRLKALQDRGLAPPEATLRLSELGRTVSRGRRDVLRKAGVLGPAWGAWTGHTISTPVTDGRRIWVKYNTGVLACFDLDGNRQWMVEHGGTTGTNSHVPSPVLAGGRLIIMVPERGFETVRDYRKVVSVVQGYDPETGRLLWTAPTAAGVTGEVTGTPLPMRLTDGRETLDVVVTANGTVIRAEDGRVLRMHLGTRERYGSPVSDGRDTVYITGPTSKAAYRLVMLDRDHVGARTLWHVYHPGVGYDSGNYALLDGGLLHAFGWRLDTLDAASGDLLALRHNLLWIRPGRCYSPMAMAGGRLYVADYGQWFGQPKGRHHGSGMSVLEPGVDGLLLARNRIELLTAGPAFDGDRLYIRSQYSLTCLGRTGPEGEAFEAEAVAREVLSQIFPGPGAPGPTPPIRLEVRPPRGQDAWERNWPELYAKDVPALWLFTGPLTRSEADAVRADLIRSDLSDVTGDRDSGAVLALGGSPRTLQVLHGYNRRLWLKDGRLDLEALGARRAGTVSLFATVVRNDVHRLLRLDAGTPGVRVWVGGVRLRHGTLVDMPQGRFPMVVEVAADEAGQDPRPMFWPSEGGVRDRERWLEDLRRRRPYLERAAELAPAGDIGRRAKDVLAALVPPG